MSGRMSVTKLTAVALTLGALAACKLPTEPSPLAPFSITDLVVGTGAAAASDDIVSVLYTGWIYDPNAAENKGRQFDSTDGKAFLLALGRGQVIVGWDQGIPGMRVGGTRRLVIPYDLAYGATGVPGTIPGYATLLFDIELLGRTAPR